MYYINSIIQWIQGNPDIVFWAMNVVLGVLYVLALYNMAVKPIERTDKVIHWNYRFNSFCLAAGLTCLILKVLFGTMDLGRAYIAFEFGDTLFFWAYLISSMLDMIEHTFAFKKDKSKGSLFKIVKSCGVTLYKFMKTPQALKKLTNITFYGFAKNATKATAYSTTLYAAVDLAAVWAISIILVVTAHIVGLRQLEEEEGRWVI